MSSITMFKPESGEERSLLGEIREALHSPNERAGCAPALIQSPTGAVFKVPPSLFSLVQEAIGPLARGQSVAVVATDSYLTTGEAAELLNVSRPYVVKLLDGHQLPYTKTGTHRRIRFDDIVAFKRHRDAQRQAGVRQLIAAYDASTDPALEMETEAAIASPR